MDECTWVDLKFETHLLVLPVISVFISSIYFFFIDFVFVLLILLWY